ncbi:alpha/beta fold hydrolase [Phyllobacterium sp. UNC302MFCol5.2]|uniref:esterase/lipase family protein n=1 Tax=Phyllobacterium sp. UNC302MFCol5.2 TaxID=1449065 RepID=UPI0004871B19|nr:alpha/beta fold hydrolase [Phyllobacterium sp. UNC302MFCol5.2]
MNAKLAVAARSSLERPNWSTRAAQKLGGTMVCRLIALLVFISLTLDAACANSKYIRRTSGSNSVIVFVHGILGNAASTWKNDNGAYWPDLLKSDPTFDGSDIYVFDYPSSFRGENFTIDQLTDNARLVLESDDIPSHSQIIFIAHSMGGLVVRAYLLKYRDVAAKTKFITFLSTPTTGSDLVGLAGLFSTNPSLFEMKPMDSKSSTFLAALQSNWLAAQFRIASFCAYETQPTFGRMVVPISSATNLCNEHLDPILADHIGIAKPSGPNDTPYLSFKSAYKSIVDTLESRLKLSLAPHQFIVFGPIVRIYSPGFAANPGCGVRSAISCAKIEHGGRILPSSGKPMIISSDGHGKVRSSVVEDSYNVTCIQFWATPQACEQAVSIEARTVAIEQVGSEP